MWPGTMKGTDLRPASGGPCFSWTHIELICSPSWAGRTYSEWHRIGYGLTHKQDYTVLGSFLSFIIWEKINGKQKWEFFTFLLCRCFEQIVKSFYISIVSSRNSPNYKENNWWRTFTDWLVLESHSLRVWTNPHNILKSEHLLLFMMFVL